MNERSKEICRPQKYLKRCDDEKEWGLPGGFGVAMEPHLTSVLLFPCRPWRQ